MFTGLLVLDINNTIITGFNTEKNIGNELGPASVDEELAQLLRELKNLGWAIVTADGAKAGSRLATFYQKELEKANLTDIISLYYPPGHQEEDTKAISLEKYAAHFQIKKENVYFYDNQRIYVGHAKRAGFNNAFVVNKKHPLIPALKKLKEETLQRNEKSEETSDTKNSSRPVFKTHYRRYSEHNLLKQEKTEEIIPYLSIGVSQVHDPDLRNLVQEAKISMSIEKMPKNNAVTQKNTEPPKLKTAILRFATSKDSIEYSLDITCLPADHFYCVEMSEKEHDLKQYFQKTFEFIDKAYEKNVHVIVESNYLPDRASSIVAAYLMKKFGLSANEACNHVRNQHHSAEFNYKIYDYNQKRYVIAADYKQQLTAYEKELKEETNLIEPVNDKTLQVPKKNFLKRHWLALLIGGLVIASAATLTFVSLGFLAPAILTIIAGWATVSFISLGGIPAAIAIGEAVALAVGAFLGGIIGKIYDAIKDSKSLKNNHSSNPTTTTNIHAKMNSKPSLSNTNHKEHKERKKSNKKDTYSSYPSSAVADNGVAITPNRLHYHK